MTKYVQGKDGKMAGSIGDGKHQVPSTSDLPGYITQMDDTRPVDPVANAFAAYRHQMLRNDGFHVAPGRTVGDAYRNVWNATNGEINDGTHHIGYEMEWPDLEPAVAKAHLKDAGIEYETGQYSTPHTGKWVINTLPTGGTELVGPAGPLAQASENAYQVELILANASAPGDRPHDVTAIVGKAPQPTGDEPVDWQQEYFNNARVELADMKINVNHLSDEEAADIYDQIATARNNYESNRYRPGSRDYDPAPEADLRDALRQAGVPEGDVYLKSLDLMATWRWEPNAWADI